MEAPTEGVESWWSSDDDDDNDDNDVDDDDDDDGPGIGWPSTSLDATSVEDGRSAALVTCT